MIDTEHPFIIKVGTKVLLNEDKTPNSSLLSHLVEQICQVHKKNHKIALVSSGAIACGMEGLGLKVRPKKLEDLQACAAIGQIRLSRAYQDLFSLSGVNVAQILVTHEDFKNRKRHLLMRKTIETLWKNHVVPIVNENDTVATQEIKFGDNDVLASLLGMMVEAKTLLLLTSEQGFFIKDNGEKKLLSQIVRLDEQTLQHIEDKYNDMSLGGMKSKLQSAYNMVSAGGYSIIASGLQPNIITNIFEGKKEHFTIVGQVNNTEQNKITSKKRWLKFYQKPEGFIKIDSGAENALIKNKKSLLPVGVKEVNGNFLKGSVVEVKNVSGQIIAHGLCQYDSKDLEKIMEESTLPNNKAEHKKSVSLEVIHRDNLVLFGEDAHE